MRFGKIAKKLVYLPRALGYAYYRDRATKARAQQEYDKSERYYKKANICHPLLGKDMLGMAVVKYRQKKYEDSYDFAKKSIEKIVEEYSGSDRDHLIYFTINLLNSIGKERPNIIEEEIPLKTRDIKEPKPHLVSKTIKADFPL